LIGDKLQGSYQEIGLFQGTLQSADTASGLFYLASERYYGLCAQRSFKWRLSTDGNRITGTFTCLENNRTKTGTWSATRTEMLAYFPNLYTCGALTPHAITAAGTWADANNRWDICFYPNDTFVASFDIGERRYYETGYVYENGRVLVGGWDQVNTGDIGSTLTFVAEDGTLSSYWWQLPLDDDDFMTLAPAVHIRQSFLAHTASAVSTRTCKRNSPNPPSILRITGLFSKSRASSPSSPSSPSTDRFDGFSVEILPITPTPTPTPTPLPPPPPVAIQVDHAALLQPTHGLVVLLIIIMSFAMLT
jgi:hypothetical protein